MAADSSDVARCSTKNSSDQAREKTRCPPRCLAACCCLRVRPGTDSARSAELASGSVDDLKHRACVPLMSTNAELRRGAVRANQLNRSSSITGSQLRHESNVDTRGITPCSRSGHAYVKGAPKRQEIDGEPRLLHLESCRLEGDQSIDTCYGHQHSSTTRGRSHELSSLLHDGHRTGSTTRLQAMRVLRQVHGVGSMSSGSWATRPTTDQRRHA